MANLSAKEWIEQTVELSESLWAYHKQQHLDDSFGWGEIFQRHAQSAGITASGLLLTGPAGCGKHTAAVHMIKHLSYNGYSPVFLDGEALADWDLPRFKEAFDGLLDHYYDLTQNLCVCLENAKQCPFRQGMLSYLGQTLNTYFLGRDTYEYTVFLILIDEEESDIPSILRNRLRLCRMNLPGEGNRLVFFKNRCDAIKPYIEPDVFVRETAGLTYAQLRDLVDNLLTLTEHQRRNGVQPPLSEELFIGFTVSQLPDPEPREAAWQLTRTMQQYVDVLPKAMLDAASAIKINVGAVAAPVQQQTAAVQQQQTPVAPVNKADYINTRQREVENMAVNALATEVFGQDGITALLQAAEHRN